MKTRMSALMDGELCATETAAVLRAMRSNGEMRSEWICYHRIRDCMHGEPGAQVDVLDRVMAALENEPTVFAPAAQRVSMAAANSRAGYRRALRPLMALAASAAGVAVVAWVALSPEMQGATPDAKLASAKPAAQAAAPVVAAAPAQPKASPRMHEYLLAHQAYAPGSNLVGGVRNIRTVSADGSR